MAIVSVRSEYRPPRCCTTDSIFAERIWEQRLGLVPIGPSRRTLGAWGRHQTTMGCGVRFFGGGPSEGSSKKTKRRHIERFIRKDASLNGCPGLGHDPSDDQGFTPVEVVSVGRAVLQNLNSWALSLERR